MAVFLDLENIALGARDANFPSFDVNKVLERLLLKGHIVVKKAYCDFDRTRSSSAGCTRPVRADRDPHVPPVRQEFRRHPYGGRRTRPVLYETTSTASRSSVATRLLALVSKLRENAKTVIGLGVQNSTSDLFINNCDDSSTTTTWYASALARAARTAQAAPAKAGLPKGERGAKPATWQRGAGI